MLRFASNRSGAMQLTTRCTTPVTPVPTALPRCRLSTRLYAVAAPAAEKLADPVAVARLLATVKAPAAKHVNYARADSFVEEVLKVHADEAPRVPAFLDDLAQKIYPGSELFHDHFAFRTFGVPGLGIQSVASVLERYGYRRIEESFIFQKKKLLAHWFAPPEDSDYDRLPRIFVSELQVEKLSQEAQAIIRKYTASAVDQAGDDMTLDALFKKDGHHRRWAAPAAADYDTLIKETDYGAWVLAHGYMLNHTAIAVHRLSGFPSGDMNEFADHLSKIVPMNLEGGLVKVSPDQLLLQSSTLSDAVEVTFASGEKRKIAGPYIEFVERKAQPQLAHIPRSQLTEIQLRDGFELASADNIFASTNAPVKA